MKHNDYTLAYNMEVPVFSFTDNENRVLYISIYQLDLYNQGNKTIKVYTKLFPSSYHIDGIEIDRSLLNKDKLKRVRSLEKEYEEAHKIKARVNMTSPDTCPFILFCRCGGCCPSFNLNIDSKPVNYSYCPICQKEEFESFYDKIKAKLNIPDEINIAKVEKLLSS